MTRQHDGACWMSWRTTSNLFGVIEIKNEFKGKIETIERISTNVGGELSSKLSGTRQLGQTWHRGCHKICVPSSTISSEEEWVNSMSHSPKGWSICSGFCSAYWSQVRKRTLVVIDKSQWEMRYIKEQQQQETRIAIIEFKYWKVARRSVLWKEEKPYLFDFLPAALVLL